MKRWALALFALAAILAADDVSFSIPKSRDVLTPAEKSAIGYDKMTENQKIAFDKFGQRYAVVVLNKFRHALGIGDRLARK
jgi:hypothetical protein